jgi:hypothetical protein
VSCAYAKRRGDLGRRSRWRRGGAARRGWRSPARFRGRRGARGRRQAMPAGPSPPCASLGELLGDVAASIAGNRKRRQKPRVRVPVADAHGGKVALTRVAAGRRSRGRRTAYKGPGTRPWRAGHVGARADLGLRGGGAVESGSGTTRARGWPAGPTGQRPRAREAGAAAATSGSAWAESSSGSLR